MCYSTPDGSEKEPGCRGAGPPGWPRGLAASLARAAVADHEGAEEKEEVRPWPTVARLIERSVEPEPMSGCWIWTGSTSSVGYGHCFRSRGHAALYAHRVIYEYFLGTIPEGFELDHKCRLHQCVNPQHLEAVTHKENCLRGSSLWAKEATQTHCLRGHRFDETNTYYRRERFGRQCRACRRIRRITR